MIMQCSGVGVSALVITLSLREHLNSRDAHAYSFNLLATIRKQFVGHLMKKK